jgi:hypothetical protein
MKGRKLLLMLAVITALVIAFSGCDMDADTATITIVNSTTKDIRFYLGEYVSAGVTTPYTSTGTIAAEATLTDVTFPSDTDVDIWYTYEEGITTYYVHLREDGNYIFNFPVDSTQTIRLTDTGWQWL